ncbi:hypothetical protein [Weissella paramesenteroides]|uniref:Uncharacterized protein n=1 Tax=Weissella paramesenteroides ATCC 33313 TaxID=585506 RepID=C5R865_WEIPA|nr:hypothetical protein [Weissella paramesenteroides]EER75649.1 hypothetical protein HMPREF0877_0160 [Weissella paramesenteroides ATCC 33313]
MDIKLTNINYRIDSTGNTSEIGTAFSGYVDNDSVNANMALRPADLEDGVTLDDLSRKQIESLGRKKLADTVAVETPDTTVTTGSDDAEVDAK